MNKKIYTVLILMTILSVCKGAFAERDVIVRPAPQKAVTERAATVRSAQEIVPPKTVPSAKVSEPEKPALSDPSAPKTTSKAAPDKTVKQVKTAKPNNAPSPTVPKSFFQDLLDKWFSKG